MCVLNSSMDKRLEKAQLGKDSEKKQGGNIMCHVVAEKGADYWMDLGLVKMKWRCKE